MPELIQQLAYTNCNISIIAIALIFIKLQYYLLNDNKILVDIEFANARQSISINNRSNVQDWIKTLYNKAE